MESNKEKNVSRFMKTRFAGDIQVQPPVQTQIKPVHRYHKFYGEGKQEICCL